MIKSELWIQDEINYLKAHFYDKNLIELRSQLRALNPNQIRTIGSIRMMASRLKLFRKQRYSDNDKKFILDNFGKLSGAEIARRLGRNPAFTYYCKKLLGITFREKQHLKDDHELLTLRLARIIGNIMGDGHVAIKNNVVTYTNFSRRRVEDFKEDVLMQFGIRMRNVRKYKKQACYVVEICNKELKNYFSKLFRALNHNFINIPDIIINANKDVKAEFLRALISDDGSVYFVRKGARSRGWVSFTSANKKLINDIQKMLSESFDIRSKLAKISPTVGVLVIKDNKSLYNFHESINFQPDALISHKSSKNYNLEKRQVLENLIKYKKNLHNYYTNDELLGYVKKFVDKNGRLPKGYELSNKNNTPDYMTYFKRFGSLNNTLKRLQS